jgi:hypothetical protein
MYGDKITNPNKMFGCPLLTGQENPLQWMQNYPGQ